MVEYDFAKVPIVDIVNQVILYAAQHKASDIHFDPLEDALMIRMRFDGDLHNHSLVPKVYERNLITRIKLVSAMNITETRLPQDGAIKGRIGGRDLDMRVSILPTNEGEKCVIRILDFQKGLSGLESLGFSPKNFKKVEKMLAVPNGIILVTGATGSGKSTTTYSMLQALNTEETNIITVEDPIEMNIEGINQVQVNSEIGMTFAAALRSILRQDPNVILIGEMRDEETAQIAVRASITGHLVLSTIHTNNSLATIERLIDMGVERYMIATAVTGIISQKLARTLCPKCKRIRRTTKYERHMFARVLHKKVKEIYEPVGCDECFKGFTGRIALHEVLYISESLRDKIADESVDKEALREEVYAKEDTTTLLQDALDKVLLGYTTFQEIYRVVDIDVDLDNEIRSDIGMQSAEDFSFDEENVEDVDWNNFDDVFDDEIDIIDVDKKDDNDLPTLNTDIIVHDTIFKLFNKELTESDPEFLNFLFKENKILREEEEKSIIEEQEEMERIKKANNYLLNDLENNLEKNLEDITKDEEIELYDNNSLANVLGGNPEDNLTTNRYLDLDNTEFNYKELLDLIDAYSNDGPTIQDIVNDSLKAKRKKELQEEIEQERESKIQNDYNYEDEKS